MEYFPDNEPAEFKTKLARPVNLRGLWEVALAELQYCSSWLNVREDMEFFYGTLQKPLKLTVHKGRYDSINDILETISDKMEDDMQKVIKFKYSHFMGKVLVHITGNAEIVWMDKPLCRLLGMKPHSMRGEGLHKGQRSVPFRISDPDLYVYTDVSAPVIVGDAHVPLLRIVTPTGEHGARVTVTYDRMHYVPVRMGNFDTIEVNISSDGGELVHFQFGKSVVKLHFRPRKLSYL
jgi:hypothetical protein